MVYKCADCNKISNHKTHYTTHINRKFPCNASPIILNAKVQPNMSEAPKNTSEVDKLKINQIDNIKLDNIKLDDSFIDKQEYQCTYCPKILSSQNILHRHMTKYCKVKKENDTKEKLISEILEEMKNEIAMLKEQNTEIKAEYNDIKTENNDIKKKLARRNTKTQNNTLNVAIDSNNNSNNNSNNKTTIENVTNNNIIVAFGTENLSKIVSNTQCNKFLERGISAITELIKHVHFNKDLPQYHNCYISNARDNHAIIFNGTSWSLVDMGEIIKALIEKNGGYLECKYEELKPLLSEIAIKQFKRYLKVRDTDELAKRYKEDIKLILYNSGEVVVATRKRMTIKDK
jgi:hypothetical protein